MADPEALANEIRAAREKIAHLEEVVASQCDTIDKLRADLADVANAHLSHLTTTAVLNHALHNKAPSTAPPKMTTRDSPHPTALAKSHQMTCSPI